MDSKKRKLKLLTKKMEQQFERKGSQIMNRNPVFYLHFLNKVTGDHYFVQEYDPIQKRFYGLTIEGTTPGEAKWGYIYLADLITNPDIEREQNWWELPYTEILFRFAVRVL